MKTIGIYAGTFDPFTMGHLEVVTKAAPLFSELIIVVAKSPTKIPVFPLPQRIKMIAESVASLSSVSVESFQGALVDFAKERKATYFVRGLRPLGDFDKEYQMGMMNHSLTGIETLFVLSSPAYSFISSSLIRELFHHGKLIPEHVPPAVYRELMQLQSATKV